MATPTPQQVTAEVDAPTEAVADNPAAVESDVPTAPPQAPAERPVSADDWHVLGSPDAPVTIVEYSDFQ
jgi:protein-disulfide isomerase